MRKNADDCKENQGSSFVVSIWKSLAVLIWSIGIIGGLAALAEGSLLGIGIMTCSGILGALCLSVAVMMQDVADTAATLQALTADWTECHDVKE